MLVSDTSLLRAPTGAQRGAPLLLGPPGGGPLAPPGTDLLRTQLFRQVAHWRAAVDRLGEHTTFAAPSAWDALERYLGVALRGNLDDAVARLRAQAGAVEAALAAAGTTAEFEDVRRLVVRLRARYIQAETLVAFYSNAVNARTGPEVAALLRACDVLARACMATVLEPLRLPVPPVLCYVDRGLGASILRSGLRLWDGVTVSAVAAIRTTWHNLLTQTAICHEAGHYTNSATGWNGELATTFTAALGATAGPAFAGWASEIAADAVAFCCTGYGAVAALHDVVAGEDTSVYAASPFDPHPPPFLRVLLNVEFCRRFYGSGPWDDLADAWLAAHPLAYATGAERPLLEHARGVLDDVTDLVLRRPYRAFGDRPLTALVDPRRVRPDELLDLERRTGPALWTSTYWLTREPLRLLALSGYRIATEPGRTPELLAHARRWMARLGDLART